MHWNRERLITCLQKKHSLFEFLVQHELIVAKRKCIKCRKPMILKENKGLDGLKWRCNTYRCGKREVYIRKNSCFFQIKVPLKKIIMIIYEWSLNTPIKNIKKDLNCDYKTINSVFNIIRRKLERV
ncbi:hypothetical protein DMUE_1035, partial [Dictyocoela muelleri]